MTLVSGYMTFGRLDRLPFNQNHFLSRMWIIMSDTRATISIHLSAAVEQVFKIGSMEPGAMLFDASKEFEVSNASLSLGKSCPG